MDNKPKQLRTEEQKLSDILQVNVDRKQEGTTEPQAKAADAIIVGDRVIKAFPGIGLAQGVVWSLDKNGHAIVRWERGFQSTEYVAKLAKAGRLDEAHAAAKPGGDKDTEVPVKKHGDHDQTTHGGGAGADARGDAVEKHGDHDQSTHGNREGGETMVGRQEQRERQEAQHGERPTATGGKESTREEGTKVSSRTSIVGEHNIREVKGSDGKSRYVSDYKPSEMFRDRESARPLGVHNSLESAQSRVQEHKDSLIAEHNARAREAVREAERRRGIDTKSPAFADWFAAQGKEKNPSVKKDGDIVPEAPSTEQAAYLQTAPVSATQTPFQCLVHTLEATLGLARTVKDYREQTSHDEEVAEYYDGILDNLRGISEDILAALSMELDEAKEHSGK